MFFNSENNILRRRGDLFAASFLFFLFFVQLSFASDIASGDSVKNKYDINDPRNPQCPCHKYQKQADDEYNQLQKKEMGRTTSVITNDNFTGESISKKHHLSFLIFKRNGNGKKLSKKKMSFNRQCRKKHSVSNEIANCFHW
jgi:hypothetical protein